MWVRMLFTKVAPRDLAVFREFYNRPDVAEALQRQPGYRFRYLLESVDHSGEIRSMTAWNSRADAEAYEQSGLYGDLVRQAQQWLTMPPQVNSYEVRE